MKTTEREEVFRGHLEECIQHLSRRMASQTPKGSKGAAKAKKPIADFCGVLIDTVHRWMYGAESLPKGGPLIRLMCYLDMIGYRVIEMERMPKSRRHFAELVGFGLLSIEQAAELLGYASTSTLYPILQGRQEAGHEKDQKMWDAWKTRKEALDQKKEDAQKLYALSIPLATRVAGEAGTAAGKPGDRTSHQTALVRIMEGLLALLEETPPDEINGVETAGLQQQPSDATILRLSAHLSALSSRIITSKQRKSRPDVREPPPEQPKGGSP